MRIEEFMVAQDVHGEWAVVIRNNSLFSPFRLVYKFGGQVIGEGYNIISKLYECTEASYKDKIFCAIQFLINPEKSIPNYKLIWEKQIELNNEEKDNESNTNSSTSL